jgi:hypothetical protein
VAEQSRIILPRQVVLADDFLAYQPVGAQAAALYIQSIASWWYAAFVQDPAADQGLNGRITVDGDGSAQGALTLSAAANNTPAGIVNAAQDPYLRLIIAQRGGAAGTRRVGLGSTALTGDPTDGIYIRHALNANLIAVARKAAAESTLDLNVAAAAGRFYDVELIVSGGGKALDVYVNGAYKGAVPDPTKISTANLGPAAASSSATPNTGLIWDKVELAVRAA